MKATMLQHCQGGRQLRRNPIPAKSRRRMLSVVAFKPDIQSGHSGMSLPLDYYQMLMLKPSIKHSAETIKRALDSALKVPLGITYQEETLFSRAVRLKAAAQVLADDQERNAYDQRRASVGMERLSQHDFPGALVLLEEVGDYESVIQFGQRWLNNNPGGESAADVAKCLALAFCDRAGELITKDSSSVVACCEDLEAAQRLLQKWSAAAEPLRMQIEVALQDMGHHYAMQLLAAPLDTPRHAKGVTVLRGLLQRCQLAGSPELRTAVAEVLPKARALLAPEEQVQVLLDASKCGIQIPDAMQQLAIAYIAHGYTAECPHSVHKAAKILSQLAAVQQQASNPSPSMQRNGGSGRASRASARLRGSSSDSVGTQGAVNEGPDVSVDRAVCAVLLGDMRQAAALLHLGPGQEDQMDPELLFFVQSKSPQGRSLDLAPGLHAVAQRWLSHVALSAVRLPQQHKAAPPTSRDRVQAVSSHEEDAALAQWYRNPKIAFYLQMRRISQSDAFLNFIVSLQNLYIRLAQKLSVVLQAAMGQAQKQGRIQTPQQQQQKSTALEGVILDAAANAAGAGKARSEVRGPLNTRAGSAAAVAAQQAVAEQVQSGMGATVGPAGPAEDVLGTNSFMSGLATPRSTRGNIVRASSSFASRAFEQATREEEAGADEKHGQAGKGMHGGDVDSHERLLQRTRQLLGPAGSGAEDASQERGGRSARAGMWARLMEEAAVHEAEEEEEEDEQVPRGELSETELRAILQRMEPAMWDNVPLPSTAQPSAQASGAGGSLLLPGGLPASKALLLGSIAMVGLAALVASKLLGFTSTHASATSSHAPMATSVASIRTAAATSAPSQAEADALVHAWFTAKAEATGPGYKVAALPGVLGSAQLRKWSDVVTQLRKDGSYWRIQLLSAKVHTIKESSRQPTQPSHTKHGPSTSSVYTLTALIHEDGQLKDTAGSTHDVYNTQYKVQYEVAKSADGSWRIVDGDDL